MSQLIDLAAPRKIVIRDRGKQFGFEVAPIQEAVWFKYFDAIVSTAERKGNEIVQHVDASSAGVELAESVALPLPIPLAHRQAVATVLTSAYAPDEQPASTADYGGDAIALHALWSADEKGTMRRHKDLVHHFTTPTAEQNRRYRRDDSRAQVVGGSRRGTTVYHGAQRTLAALYDELIIAVEGYTVGDSVLTADAAAIRRYIDTYHKVSAVVKLFAPAEVEIEEETE